MVAFGDRFIALVLALGVLAAVITPARAGPYEDALAHFTADSFDQTIEGINAVAASGNAFAAPVISALQKPFFSADGKRVFIRETGDRLDRRRHRPTGCHQSAGPRAGASQQPPAADRGGGARRLDADGAGCGQAAGGGAGGAQVQGSQCAAGARPGDRQGERCPGRLVPRRAAVVLYSDNASDDDKLDAIALIRQRGDQDALALLGGLPASASPAVKKAASEAIASVQNSLRALDRGAERLVRALARLGPAARRHRARHHLSG